MTLAILFGASLALIRIEQTTDALKNSTLSKYSNTSVTMIGEITELPTQHQVMRKYVLDVIGSTTSSGTLIAERGKILVSDRGGWPVFHIGDTVKVSGKISQPKNGEGFDYGNYLSVSGITATIDWANIELANDQYPRTKWIRILAVLERTRDAIEMKIGRIFPEPESTLLTGLLTGSDGNMSKSVKAAFQKTGLAHITAISGTNVTIVLAVMSSLLFWIPRNWRLLPLALAALLFMLLTGASASVVRATIMGILGLIAVSVDRPKIPRLLILWTAAGMVLYNPRWLWYDPGFQLSFLATIGIAELSPLLHRWCRWLPKTLGLRESTVATLAAYIATTPLSALLFKQISIVAPLANLITAPLIPLSMLLGSISTLLSVIWFPLGQFIGFFAYITLKITILTATLLGSLPLATLSW